MAGPTLTSGLNARFSLTRGDLDVSVDLRVDAGQTVALLGPNGAGKSTVLSAVAGLVPIDSGEIALDGRVLSGADPNVFVPPERRRIGVVFQDLLLFGHMTVRQNVEFGLRNRRMAKAELAESVDRWVARMNLEEIAGRKARDLSGGEAQRVALARALIIEPELLLLDEPMSALDTSARIEMRHDLAEHLKAFKGPRLLITHDPTEAFLLSDRISVIESGQITQSGSGEDIRLRPKTPYAADLAGSNLFRGDAIGGNVDVDGHVIHIADLTIAGPVLATIHPRAVAVYRNRPEGSPRNTWQTIVTRLEHFGDRVRLKTGAPLPMAVEVTPEAVIALNLVEGSQVFVTIKATEVQVEPG